MPLGNHREFKKRGHFPESCPLNNALLLLLFAVYIYVYSAIQ